MYYGFYATAVEPRNPGHAAVGMVLADENKRAVYSKAVYLGDNISVWFAEFKGMQGIVRQAIKLGATEIQVGCSNSQIVKQISGKMMIHEPALYDLAQEIMLDMATFDKVSIKKVDRTKNTVCVRLAEEEVRKYSKTRANPYFSVTQSGVQFRRMNKGLYRVLGGEEYFVDLRTRECTCPAYQYHPEKPCKHLIAVLGYERKFWREKSNI